MFRPYRALKTQGGPRFYRYTAPPGHMIIQENLRLLRRSGEARPPRNDIFFIALYSILSTAKPGMARHAPTCLLPLISRAG